MLLLYGSISRLRVPFKPIIRKAAKILNRQKPIRTVLTKNFRVGRLALGERNSYLRCALWQTADWEDADYRVNFQKPVQLPLPTSSMDLIYSAHMLEHLQDEPALRVLKECRRLISPGGTLRLNLPDAEKIVDAFQSPSKAFSTNTQKKNKHF